MKVNQLFEVSVGRTGVKTNPIDAAEAIKFCKENDGAYDMVKKNKPFYRGMERVESAYTFGDTATFTRKAANTKNFINLFVSSSRNWSHYPKRNKSFPGATNRALAADYGNVFAMLPADDAKVGICPDFDFWRSFKTLKNFGGVSDINEFLADLDTHLNADDATVLREQLGEIDKHFLEQSRESASVVQTRSIDSIIGLMNQYHERDLESLFETLFDPDENDFKVESGADAENPTGEVSYTQGKEVWVEGRALFINLDVWQPIRKGVLTS